MSVIDPTDVDFDGEQVKALSEAIMTAVYSKPELKEFHTLVPGIKAKKQIIILGALGLVGKVTNGQCAPTTNPGTIEMSQKLWDPAYIEDRFVQCWKDLRESFWIWSLKTGVDKADLTGTDFANFLEERLADAMREAVLRLAWFGDTAAANYNDSPAGFITNGIDTDYFTPFNGLWKQIFAIATANTDQYKAITKNSAATYLLQRFDDTDTTNQVVTNLMQSMLDDADTRLSEATDNIFYVTKSVADQYKRERKRATGIDLAYSRVEQGILSLEIDGVKIYAMTFWDRNIKDYENNGTKWHLPHRIVLAPKSNVQVGTEEESNLTELKPFYFEKDKEYYVDFGFNLDAKFVEDYKGMFAY